MNSNTKSKNDQSPLVSEDTDGCSLALSADQQWLRLNVSGKQVVSFHVNYVRKILAEADKQKASKVPLKKSEISAGL